MGPRLLDEDLQGRLKKPVASAAADCDSVGEVRHPDVSTVEAVALNQPTRKQGNMPAAPKEQLL
ncbi:hypothetical protein EG329_002109 [Mollisiaceae sp. DMI_Dod_QoI]|nr:hypothetical protein EG329_002109 [Helotiales sp. DMI_Dod_QoI]